MNIQSLSVCVPAGCPNNCKFCVSQMREEPYADQIQKNEAFRDLYKADYKRRLEFARDNGCNTVVLTGNGEPLSNRSFLDDFFEWNDHLSSPFRWIDIQTCGIGLVKGAGNIPQPKLRWLRNAGVSTIAISLSAMNSEKNAEYNGTPTAAKVNVEYLCQQIKKYDFNLRLSLNLTDGFVAEPFQIFRWAKTLGANQITFRVLYDSGLATEQDAWIKTHALASDAVHDIDHYVRDRGRKLERLPFGAYRYSVEGMSTVIDDDCMSTQEDKETMRYLVLRPDCKLYSKWDEPGSLIF